jgi:hypothetical protein
MDSGLKQPHYLNNFQRSRLGGLKGPLHLCLQICSNYFFFCFIKKIVPYLSDYSG